MRCRCSGPRRFSWSTATSTLISDFASLRRTRACRRGRSRTSCSSTTRRIIRPAISRSMEDRVRAEASRPLHLSAASACTIPGLFAGSAARRALPARRRCYARRSTRGRVSGEHYRGQLVRYRYARAPVGARSLASHRELIMNLPIDPRICAERRLRLARAMQRGVAVMPTAPERVRNRDAHYPFRYDSYFYYLTGFREPEAVLVVIAGDEPRSVLFCREKNEEREIWDGFRYRPRARARSVRLRRSACDRPARRADAGPSRGSAGRVLPPRGGCGVGCARHALGERGAGRARARASRRRRPFSDVHVLLDEMRVVKDAAEIGVMRRAADDLRRLRTAARCSSRSPGSASSRSRPSSCTSSGVTAHRRPRIRRSSHRALTRAFCITSRTTACCADGDLLLIDAGCELDGYASDITRTFPVNGRFSAPQRDVYELVLAAQSAAIAQVKPGNRWIAPHDAAVRVLAQGFVDFGLLEGPLEQRARNGKLQEVLHASHRALARARRARRGRIQARRRVARARAGHDAHGGARLLHTAGRGVPEQYADIGVRIEDDALVTESGCEIITADAPKTVADIEALMRARDASVAISWSSAAGPSGRRSRCELRADGLRVHVLESRQADVRVDRTRGRSRCRTAAGSFSSALGVWVRARACARRSSASTSRSAAASGAPR